MMDGKEWNQQAVMDVVCNALASSSKSLTTILADGHAGNTLPDFATVARWLARGGNICEQYARAKEAQADFMAEELAELHNKAWVPAEDDKGNAILVDGKPIMTVDKASAAIVRIEADNKKWLMSKLRPKKYGEKLEIENNHTVRDDTDSRLMKRLGEYGVMVTAIVPTAPEGGDAG